MSVTPSSPRHPAGVLPGPTVRRRDLRRSQQHPRGAQPPRTTSKSSPASRTTAPVRASSPLGDGGRRHRQRVSSRDGPLRRSGPPRARSAPCTSARRGTWSCGGGQPQPRPAALATYYVALAYDGPLDTATQTYVRITQDFNNTRNARGQEDPPGDEPRRSASTSWSSPSSTRASTSSASLTDRALHVYNTVATDARFATATGHDEHVHDALASIALINTNLARWNAHAAGLAKLPARATRAGSAPRPSTTSRKSPTARQLERGPHLPPGLPAPHGGDGRHGAVPHSAVRHRPRVPKPQRHQQYRRALREVVTVFGASGAAARLGGRCLGRGGPLPRPRRPGDGVPPQHLLAG